MFDNIILVGQSLIRATAYHASLTSLGHNYRPPMTSQESARMRANLPAPPPGEVTDNGEGIMRSPSGVVYSKAPKLGGAEDPTLNGKQFEGAPWSQVKPMEQEDRPKVESSPGGGKPFSKCSFRRLMHRHELPKHLQFNPYIDTGYRPLLSAWECIMSLFYLHNETVNIITHGESNIITHGESNIITHGESNIITHGESNIITHGESNIITHGESNIITRCDSNIIITHGESNIITHGESNIITHGESNIITHGESNIITRGDSNIIITHGESNIITHGESNIITHGESNIITD